RTWAAGRWSAATRAGAPLRAVPTHRRRRCRWGWWPLWARLLRGRQLAPPLVFTSASTIPAPDGPVMRAAILLTYDVAAGNTTKNVQPRRRVAADLDLRLDGSKRVEGLVQQVAHHACLRHVAGRPDVAHREIVV